MTSHHYQRAGLNTDQHTRNDEPTGITPTCWCGWKGKEGSSTDATMQWIKHTESTNKGKQ